MFMAFLQLISLIIHSKKKSKKTNLQHGGLKICNGFAFLFASSHSSFMIMTYCLVLSIFPWILTRFIHEFWEFHQCFALLHINTPVHIHRRTLFQGRIFQKFGSHIYQSLLVCWNEVESSRQGSGCQQQTGSAKVCKFHFEISCQKNIFRFQIAVTKRDIVFEVVDIRKAGRDASGDSQLCVQPDVCFGVSCQNIMQVSTINVFHYDAHCVGPLGDANQLYYVRVVKSTQDMGLATNPAKCKKR